MARHVFTVVTRILDESDARSGLKQSLADIQLNLEHPNLEDNGIIDFNPQNFPQLHFASFVIFDDTLVFENSVTGNRDAYLQSLATHEGLDRIYQYCADYPDLAQDPTAPAEKRTRERYKYLRRKLKKANLRHVGTPTRSVQSILKDEEVVATLTADAFGSPATSLRPGAPAPAMRESWNWEVIKPYLIIVSALLLLAWVVYCGRQRRVFPLLTAESVVLIADMVLAGVGGGLFLLKEWRSTPAPFRARALSVIGRVIMLVAFIVFAWRSGRAHWFRVVALIGGAAGVFMSLVVDWSRAKSERIAVLREATSAAGIVECWRTMVQEHDRNSARPYEPERGPVWEHLWNWRYWFLAPVVATAVVGWLTLTHPLWLYWGLLTAFTLEAIWMTILVGLPPIAGIFTPAGARFVVGTVVFAWLVLESLRLLAPHPVDPFGVDWHPAIYAGVVLLAWFAVQALTLATPEVEVTAPTDAQRATIEEVGRQEDLGVQNHMALAARVGRARGLNRLRIWSLRFFLWSLDRIFYRALLPDVYRGRLFGIPTVHSAQWVILDDGRYLFLSNYDHSFTTYLNDFGTQIPSGIQKIWGICDGNPGMADVERFKLFVRKAMVPHQVWYRAYPNMSVRQIWNNEGIRKNLAGDIRDEERMVATMRRFGGAPKIVPGIVHAAR
jgi:hypothetical protein